jgi:ubiquinone/menaquinone biosynthesis C-methylase UbiE
MKWVERLAARLSHRNRTSKYRQFLELVRPSEGDTILDVGVADREFSESDNYLEKHYPHPQRIVAVAQHSLDHFARRYPGTRAVIADGRALPFANDEFDIVYSNAVIEHTGSREDQLVFLRELHRVARRGYLTTPNRHFPVEVHTRVPLLHILLPKQWFDAFLTRVGKGWATGSYMNLLSEQDLRELLRDAGIADYSIARSRLLVFTITFSVTWAKPPEE